MKAIFPISVDKFFDYLLSEEAVFSFADHRKNRGGNSSYKMNRLRDYSFLLVALGGPICIYERVEDRHKVG
jgi:hypothetical protein